MGMVCMVYTILLYYASRIACRNPGISRRGWLDAFFVSFQPFRRGMCTTEQTLLRVGVHYYVDDRQKSFMILYILYNIHIRVYVLFISTYVCAATQVRPAFVFISSEWCNLSLTHRLSKVAIFPPHCCF